MLVQETISGTMISSDKEVRTRTRIFPVRIFFRQISVRLILVQATFRQRSVNEGVTCPGTTIRRQEPVCKTGHAAVGDRGEPVFQGG